MANSTQQLQPVQPEERTIASAHEALPEAASAPLVVEQEKLAPAMLDFVRVLTQVLSDKPLEWKIDRRALPGMLNAFLEKALENFPPSPQRDAAAAAFTETVNGVVGQVSVSEAMPRVLVRISAARSRLEPGALPEPNEPAVLASFDAIDGVIRRCIVAAEATPALDGMAVDAGVIVISQPALPSTQHQTDLNHPFETAGLYGEQRYRDPLVGGGAVLSEEFIREQSPILNGMQMTESEWLRISNARAVAAASALSAGAVALSLAAGAAPRPNFAQQPPAAEEAEKRQGEHERRAEPHERRGPGRPGSFDTYNNTGTEGLTPPEREEIARLARRAAAAESEITEGDGSPMAERTIEQAEALGIPQLQETIPQRPTATQMMEETIALTPGGTAISETPISVEQQGAPQSAEAQAEEAPVYIAAGIDAVTGELVTSMPIYGPMPTLQQIISGNIPVNLQRINRAQPGAQAVQTPQQQAQQENEAVVGAINPDTGTVLADQLAVGGQGVTQEQVVTGNISGNIATRNVAPAAEATEASTAVQQQEASAQEEAATQQEQAATQQQEEAVAQGATPVSERISSTQPPEGGAAAPRAAAAYTEAAPVGAGMAFGEAEFLMVEMLGSMRRAAEMPQQSSRVADAQNLRNAGYVYSAAPPPKSGTAQFAAAEARGGFIHGLKNTFINSLVALGLLREHPASAAAEREFGSDLQQEKRKVAKSAAAARKFRKDAEAARQPGPQPSGMKKEADAKPSPKPGNAAPQQQHDHKEPPPHPPMGPHMFGE